MRRTNVRAGAVLAAAVLSLAGCTGSSGAHGATATATGSTSGTSAGRAGEVGGFDVTAENRKPGTTAWNIPQADQASDTELAGFVDHDSVLPGTKLALRVTTTYPTFTVAAYRMGWYGGKGGRLVWSGPGLPRIQQPAPIVKPGNEVDASNWTPSTTIDTRGWPPGLYLLKLSGGGKAKWIPLVVRSSSLAGKLAIVYATPTYEAYNAWGGWSLYTGPHGTRATHVSFNRPYDKSGARLVTAGERQVTALAEKEGLPTAYVSQADISDDPGLVRGARGLVSLGHDEYWTTQMRSAWESARDHGTNLAFLGANALYWRIRIEGRTIVGYKWSAGSDPVQGAQTTAQWRQAPHPDPENSLTGQLYECFPAHGALKVSDPSFFLFNGTGAKSGSTYNGLVGVEIDRAYPIAGTPADLQVVAHSPVQCGSVGPTYSDMTYYTAPSGAGVFASGSMNWAVGLLGPNPNRSYQIDQAASAFSATVTGNLLRAMAAGPMGKTHPSQSNLAGLHESASTSTGTGGPIG